MIDFTRQIDYPIRLSGAADNGVGGSYYASHAERQAAVLDPGQDIEVSRIMCSDCRGWFQALADATGISAAVTDPEGTRFFEPSLPDVGTTEP